MPGLFNARGPAAQLANAVRRRSAVPTGMAGALLLAACGGGADVGGQVPTSTTLAEVAIVTAPAPLVTDAIFAPGSFWYAPIPANAPLHANSAGFVADFLRQKKAYYGTVNINTSAYASPVYIAASDTPTTKVGYSNCQKKSYPEPGLEAQWAAVPIPAFALPADGSDAEMTVYQPSTDTLWEFWVTRQIAGGWQACWGGKMSNVSASDGTWPHPYGTTATGLPFVGGQITAEELSRGEIRHAIGISLVEAEAASVVSWPARRSDGHNPQAAPNRIPEGLRLRLDPAIQVDALPMSTAGKIIARAAQKYGFVVWDKAGALSIRAQNPKSYTALGKPDPYVALFAGQPSYAVLNGFPWDRLQFLPKDYGKP
ncbi:MAG TPA: DUF4124 domain-containing protein [Telluria sp.]